MACAPSRLWKLLEAHALHQLDGLPKVLRRPGIVLRRPAALRAQVPRVRNVAGFGDALRKEAASCVSAWLAQDRSQRQSSGRGRGCTLRSSRAGRGRTGRGQKRGGGWRGPRHLERPREILARQLLRLLILPSQVGIPALEMRRRHELQARPGLILRVRLLLLPLLLRLERLDPHRELLDRLVRAAGPGERLGSQQPAARLRLRLLGEHDVVGIDGLLVAVELGQGVGVAVERHGVVAPRGEVARRLERDRRLAPAHIRPHASQSLPQLWPRQEKGEGEAHQREARRWRFPRL